MAAEKSISSLSNSFKEINLEGNNDSVIQSKFLDLVFNKKRNILLSSPGGCGKSWLIINIIKKEAEQRGLSISLTSTTGVSALSIGGTTINRWGSIKLGKESIMTICTRIKNNKETLKRWNECKILVIDEISMMGVKTFELLDNVGRNICESNLPFGGKQLILSGDFLQLPPIGDSFIFKSEIWDTFNFRFFRLTTPKRYPDIDHFNMLMNMRLGNTSKDDTKKMYGRVDAYIDYIRKGLEKKEKIKPTRIYSLKKDVETFNLDELSKLEGKTIVYNSIDKFSKKLSEKEKLIDKNERKKDNISGKDVMDCTEFLDTVVNRQILLKPGAQIMLTYNLAIDIGLVNGSRGVVLSCDQDSINVLFKNGITTRIGYNKYEFDDGKILMVRYQLPIILAWATSIHKCVDENTLISTENGLIRIKDISTHMMGKNTNMIHPDNSILHISEKIYGRNGINKTSEIYKGCVEKSLKITTKLGYSIEGSHKHPILVYDNGKEVWKTLPFINKGDYIVFRTGLFCGRKDNITTDMFTIEQYREGSKKIYSIPQTIDEDICYVIGLLVGDGTYCYSTNGDYKIGYVTLDNELINKFKSVMDTKFKTDVRIFEDNGAQRCIVSSKMIRNFFEIFGLSYTKRTEKTVPWCILENTVECQRKFIKGLFDTDGGINNSCIHFTNTSEKVIDITQILLLNNGIISSKRVLREATDKWSKVFRIQICGINARKYMSTIGFFCLRKQKQGIKQYGKDPSIQLIPKTNICSIPDSYTITKTIKDQLTTSKRNDSSFHSFIYKRVGRGDLNSTICYDQLPYLIQECKNRNIKLDPKIQEWVNNGIFFDRVDSIEEGLCQMYDIAVPEDHTFIANGIVNHNCQGATLDYAIMDLGSSIFAPGMAYVALSRVRTLDGLLLSSFVPKKIIADPEALEFERMIEAQEKDEDIDYEIEKGGGMPQEEGRPNKQVKQQEITVLRGTMCGETMMVDKIPGVDKHIVAFIMADCPEIYEIMDPDMWKKLKGLEAPLKVDNETLYSKLLELLELESGETGDEDDNEPGGLIDCEEDVLEL